MKTRDNLLKLEGELNAKYINRADEIRGLMLSLLSRGNVVLLGPAGTAKTDLVQCLARSLGADCFETLLTRTSSPEELFGAYDIRELEQGRYMRNTENTLATAQFGFVDEVFKCNSATLNGLLGVMAQRIFRNGNSMPSPIPLQLLVGASNEMPEGGETGELSALWDRFELRYVVKYIGDERSFARLLSINSSLEPKTKVKMADIIKAQKETDSVSFDNILPILINLWKALRTEGFSISDRKWRNSIKYLRSNAWIEGRDEVNEDDIMVYNHILWSNPEQIHPIHKVVSQFIRPELAISQEQYDIACEIMAGLDKFTSDEQKNKEQFHTTKAKAGSDAYVQVNRIRKALQTNQHKQIAQGFEENKRIKGMIEDVDAMLVKLRKEILMA